MGTLLLFAAEGATSLGVSDSIWNALITGVVGIVILWLTQRAAARALEKKVTESVETAKKTHALVNSGELIRLKLYWIALDRLAGETKEEADIEAARLAKELYDAHKATQEAVDRRDAAGLPAKEPGPPPADKG